MDHSDTMVGVVLRLIRRAWKACKGKVINHAHFEPKGYKAEALVELMGPRAAIPEVKRVQKKKQLIHYIKGNSFFFNTFIFSKFFIKSNFTSTIIEVYTNTFLDL